MQIITPPATPYVLPGNPDAVALRRWLIAIANGNASYIVLGNSIMDKDRGGANEANRIPCLLRDQLQTKVMGAVQGAGYIPASHYNVASAWTYGGGNPTDSSVFGVGRMTTILVAGTANTASITVDCDRFQLLGLGSSSGTVTIDGGAPQPLLVTAAGFDGRIVFDSGALAPGAHTILCTAPAAGVHFYLNGILVFNGDSPTTGIHKWESANPQTQALYLLPSAYGGSATGPSANFPYWVDAMDTANPDLILPEFGINEELGPIGTGGQRSASDFKKDLKNLVSIVTAKTPGQPPSVLPLVMWAHSFNNNTEAVWLPYRQAIIDAAAANGWARPVDIYDSAGYIGTDPYALTVDKVHASLKGKHLIVNELVRRLAPDYK